MKLCIAGHNVPLTPAFDSEGKITVTKLISSLESTVAVPVGTDAEGAGDYAKESYAAVIQSEMSDYDDDNNKISSYVFAFDSYEFISSAYNEQSSVSNKNLTLACAERAVGAENTGISFVSKTITNESYSDAVSESSANAIKIVFMGALPIAAIAMGIYIYFRRKNA